MLTVLGAMDKSQRRIRRSPSVKRRSKVLPVGQRLTLERVLGLTVSNNAAFTCDAVSGVIAYPAGCVAVLFNPRKNRQSHIFNVSKKTITSMAFSADGKHLVTGECGHQPAVRVWEVEEKTQVAEFHGHKFGVNCVAFSPNLRYIVSIGSQHDMMVNVWNWKTGNKVASNKVSCKVSAVAFGADSSFFVTVGNRHVKFWYLDNSQSKINQTVPLLGHSGILGEHKNNYFCDVACGQGKTSGNTYIITQSGLLCEFNDKRLLEKWVELRTKRANCITAGEEHIFIGCAGGVVRVFSASSLQFVATLPHPHHLGVDVATATSSSDLICMETNAKYPDVVAVTLDDKRKKVSCIYNDHSLYVWDVENLHHVGKAWSFLFHSGCVWALEVYPHLENGQTGALPPGSFLTASSDNTIRVWNLDPRLSHSPGYAHNIYSSELLKVVYTDPTHSFLCDINYNPAGGTDKTDTTWDGKNGVRSIRVSPDGQHLASGDRQGNVRIFDLQQMSEIRCIEAHESDVVCLEYSFSKAGPKLLASGSRDRLIHVFDVEQDYGLLQTLDDHSAAIQSVRFTDANNRLGMLSCGSDKSLLFRNATLNAGEFEFSLDQHLVSKSTMYDMIIHPTHKFVATACQDRSVRIYNMKTAKQKKKYCASLGDEGTLLRAQLDPSGTYVATSCTDKNVCVLEFYTGEFTATVYGHSEIITGLRFTNDLKHLISVSADGCIFVWRLSSEMTKTMRMRMEELGKMPKDETFVIDQRTITSPPLFPMMTNISPSTVLSCMEPHPLSSLRLPSSYPDTPVRKRVEASPPLPSSAHFNICAGPLPSWAKAKLDDTADGVDEGVDTAQPRGRWAQRYDHNLAFKSQLELSQMEETDFDARSVTRQEAGGLQGGMLASSLPDLRRETVVLSQQHLPSRNIPIIDDDDETNVDDDEDFYPADMKDALPRNEKDGSSFDVEGRRRSQTGDSLGGWSDRDGDRRWSNCTSLGSEDMTRSTDFDDMEDSDAWPDATKIVYPPSKPDVTDPCDSTFQVYAAEEVRKRRRRHTISFKADEDGETGHQVPAEHREGDSSVHDDMVTTSTTAASHANADHLDLPHTSDKEQFVKENFESVAFTPVAMDKFVQQVASMEQATDVSCDQTGIPFSPRLSLSSRFLSRSRFVGVRSGARLGTKRNVDNHVNPEPKSKTLLAQYMEDMRSCLASTNWRTGGLLHESPEKDVPLSPPTKLKSKELSFSSPVATTFESPAGKLETENYPTHYVPAQDLPCSASQRIPCAPTNRKAHARASNRGRRASTEGTRSREVRGSRSSSVPPSPCHAPSYCRTTKSSRLKSSASSSNLLKQTDSQHSSAPTAGDKGKATGGKTKKSCLTSSHQARHKSTPNLIVYPETGKKVSEREGLPRESSSNLCRVASLSLSEPDICGMENHTSKGTTAAHFFPAHTNQEPGPQHPHTRKSAHDRMLVHAGNTDSRRCLPCQDGELMDTHLMPPPSALSDAQRSLLRRAAQARKGLTSDLTLEQAKSILLGNSGILESPHVSTATAPATSVETPAQCPGNGMAHDESDMSTASDGSVVHQNSAPELFCSTAVGSPVSSHSTPLLHADFSPSTFHEATSMAHHGQTNRVQATEEVVPTASQPAWDRKPVASTDVDTTRFDVPEHDQPRSQSTQPCAGTVNLLHNVFSKEIVIRDASGACPGGQDSERGSVQDEISQTDFECDSSGSKQVPVCSGASHCSSEGPDCGENVELSSLPLTEGSPAESDAPCHHSTPGQHESQHCPSPQGQTLSPQEQTLSTCSQSTQEQSPSVCSQSPQRQSVSTCIQSPQGQSVSCSQSPHALSVKSCSQSPHGLSASLCSQSPQGLSVSSCSQSPHALSVLSCSQSPQRLSASSCSQSPDQSVSPRSQCDTGLGSDTDDTDCDARQSAGNPPCGEEQIAGRSSGHPSPPFHNSFTACPHTEDRTRDLMTKCTNVVADLEAAIQRTKDLHTEVTQSSPERPAYHHHHQMMSRLSEAIHQAHLTLAELALHPSSTPLPRSCPLTGGEPASTVTQWDRDVMEQAGNMLRPLMWGLSQELCQEVVKVVREQLEGGPSS